MLGCLRVVGGHSGTEGGGNAPTSWMPTAVKQEEEEGEGDRRNIISTEAR